MKAAKQLLAKSLLFVCLVVGLILATPAQTSAQNNCTYMGCGRASNCSDCTQDWWFCYNPGYGDYIIFGSCCMCV